MRKYWYVVMWSILLVCGLMVWGCGHWPWDRGKREGPNVLVNPGFDENPWDTGWTIDTFASSDEPIAIAEAAADTGRSLPKSCLLKAIAYKYSGGTGGFSGCSRVMISQTFNEIRDCKVKAYVKFRLSSDPEIDCGDTCKVSIQVLVNSQWATIWEVCCPMGEDYVAQYVWAEVSTTIVKENVSGIRFCAFTRYENTCTFPGEGACNQFWIDDVYVGEIIK